MCPAKRDCTPNSVALEGILDSTEVGALGTGMPSSHNHEDLADGQMCVHHHFFRLQADVPMPADAHHHCRMDAAGPPHPGSQPFISLRSCTQLTGI